MPDQTPFRIWKTPLIAECVVGHGGIGREVLPWRVSAAGSFSSFLNLLTEVLKKQRLELLLPRVRRRQANVVLPDKCTDARQGVLSANVWAGLTTAVSLLFAVERMQRGVTGDIEGAHDNPVTVSNASSVLPMALVTMNPPQ